MTNATQQKPRILVDMSVTLLHHGHIRLLKRAAEMGYVVVALTIDDEIKNKKGYTPELSYEERKEIIESISYVDQVIPANWLIDNAYLEHHNIDLLVHGDDNSNDIPKEKLTIFPRTEGISSSDMRKRVLNSLISMNTKNSTSDSPSNTLTQEILKSIRDVFKMD